MLAFPPALRAAAALTLLTLFATLVQAQISLSIVDEKVADGEDRIEAALQQRVSFNFPEEPLKQVIEILRDKTGLPLIIATKKLEEAA
ncbi:MAG: hypothetical protein K8R36_21280, partial [Planctomycetales bacterium]|nr:hypothetical protein [Planctomycetales bacterium]